MAKKILEITAGEKAPEIVNAIIEIPKGSRNKYELDRKTGLFKLDRVLNSPFHYATEYGIIPNTLCDDNDPLDILVLIDQPTFPGCLIEARPIAALELVDSGKKDTKILAVPVKDKVFGKMHDLRDCDADLLNEIALFFKEYKRLEKKKVTVKKWHSAETAKKEILKAIKMFKKAKK